MICMFVDTQCVYAMIFLEIDDVELCCLCGGGGSSDCNGIFGGVVSCC